MERRMNMYRKGAGAKPGQNKQPEKSKPKESARFAKVTLGANGPERNSNAGGNKLMNLNKNLNSGLNRGLKENSPILAKDKNNTTHDSAYNESININNDKSKRLDSNRELKNDRCTSPMIKQQFEGQNSVNPHQYLKSKIEFSSRSSRFENSINKTIVKTNKPQEKFLKVGAHNMNDAFLPKAFTKFHCFTYKNSIDSNNNLYKNEKKYKMSKYLTFESDTEENRSHTMYEKGTIIWFYLIEIMQLFHFYELYKIMNNIKLKKTCVSINIILILLTLILSVIKKKSDFFLTREIKRVITKIILLINYFSFIYCFIRYSIDNSYHNRYLNTFLICILLLFDSSFSHTLLIAIIDTLLITLAYYQKLNHIISKEMFKLVLTHLYSLMSMVIADYFIRKARRELWVLLDSFKCSYHYINNSLMSGIDLPIFILSKMKTILYYNVAGEKFCNDIMNLREDYINKQKFVDFEFKNFLLDEDLFDKYLLKALLNENSTYFLFPFVPKNNIDIGSDKIKFTKTDSNLIYTEINCLNWFQIIVSPCIWKGNECFYLQLFPYDDMKFHDFFTEKLNNLSDNLEILIDELDNACLEYKKRNNDIISIEALNKRTLIEKRSNFVETAILNINSVSRACTKTKKDWSVIMQPKSEQENKVNQILLSSNKQQFTVNYNYFDYGMWFLLSNKTYKLYTIFSTLQIFGMYFLHHLYNDDYQKIKLDEFISSISELFYTSSQVSGFSIDFSVKGNNEISLNVFFLNCIIVNLISFILYNHKSKDKSKKINFLIEVVNKKEFLDTLNSRKNENNEDGIKRNASRMASSGSVVQHDSSSKVSNQNKKIKENASSFNNNILITEDDLVIKITLDYSDSQTIHSLMTASGYFYEEVHSSIDKEMDKLNIIPFGIYVANYIVSLIYYNKISCDTDDQQIYFYALGRSISGPSESKETNINPPANLTNVPNNQIEVQITSSSQNQNEVQVTSSNQNQDNISETVKSSAPITDEKNDKKIVNFYNFYTKDNYDINKLYYNKICILLYKIKEEKIDTNITIFKREYKQGNAKDKNISDLFDGNYSNYKSIRFHNFANKILLGKKLSTNSLNNSSKKESISDNEILTKQLRLNTEENARKGNAEVDGIELELIKRRGKGLKCPNKSSTTLGGMINPESKTVIIDENTKRKTIVYDNIEDIFTKHFQNNINVKEESKANQINDNKATSPDIDKKTKIRIQKERKSIDFAAAGLDKEDFLLEPKTNQRRISINVSPEKINMNKEVIKTKHEKNISANATTSNIDSKLLNVNDTHKCIFNSINTSNSQNKIDDSNILFKSMANLQHGKKAPSKNNKLLNITDGGSLNNSHSVSSENNRMNTNNSNSVNEEKITNVEPINLKEDIESDNFNSNDINFNTHDDKLEKEIRKININITDGDAEIEKSEDDKEIIKKIDILDSVNISKEEEKIIFEDSNESKNEHDCNNNDKLLENLIDFMNDKKAASNNKKIFLSTDSINKILPKDSASNLSNTNLIASPETKDNINNVNVEKLNGVNILNSIKNIPKSIIFNDDINDNLDVDILLSRKIKLCLDKYNKNKIFNSSNELYSISNSTQSKISLIKFKPTLPKTNTFENQKSISTCKFINNKQLSYNNKILFVQDTSSRLYENKSSNFYLLKNSKKLKEINFTVDYVNGNINKLLKKLSLSSHKCQCYPLIIVESSKPDEYEKIQSLVNMSKNTKYNTIFIKVIRSYISSKELLFEDFIIKNQFKNSIEEILNRIEYNDNKDYISYLNN